ncbi:DUF2306 domain-containing protein [Flavobacterium sp. LS1R47]|uniref:DUF2306 domain-containing protein n=1 Tax=Flavobacterium frigoritolerans TaxID=2987686 RepID=A0A9X2YYE5_9FLAO|nr:DUF2306 domain-containing protein [Flavobacterium frigoritolerans]MCV9931563.1 DUF2306 domain-containing protein [Flavobacterium frigoritolerans]
MAKKTLWVLFATFAIIIGLYPILYFLLEKNFGLLSSKSDELLNSIFWNYAFYIHIVLGGLALLIGWVQFSPKMRTRRIILHRQIGKVYVISSILSALASLYVAFYATGGLTTALGFTCLGVLWFYTTLRAYLDIKKGMINSHKKMMIYSYALCFAAVTLRIWLPILVILFNEFMTAYKIVAWLCWVPNLLVALLIVKKMEKQRMVN